MSLGDSSQALTGGDETAVVSPSTGSLEIREPHDAWLGRGASLGRYVVIDPLGSGGMGVVYLAYDPELDRRVALKLLRVHGIADDGGGGQARLLREAQTMAKLSHPNVVPVYDVGTVAGGLFVAMEYIHGQTLRAWLRETRRNWREIRSVAMMSARGLQAAHAKGIVHRDFKPTNVLVDEDGRARVLDFGLALISGQEEEMTAPPVVPEGLIEDTGVRTLQDVSLTRAGIVMGTPAYMSPEQWEGKELGPASDQFSFCVVLYEALYGFKPFEGEERDELSKAVRSGKVRRPPSNNDVPRWLHRAVMRGLNSDPERRFPDMQALLDTLDRDPGRSVRLGAMAGAAVLAAGGLWLATQRAEQTQRALCSDSGAHMDEVWNDARRQSLREGFEAQPLPYSTDAATRAIAALDDLANAYKEQRREACEATQIRHEQSELLMDLRMACLDSWQWELESLVAVLTDPDATTVENAGQSIEGLTELSRCADGPRLQSQVPAPDDPQTAEAVDELHRLFGEIRANDGTGAYAEALELAEGALQQASGVDYEPVLAHAHYWLGRELVQAGSFEPAEKELSEAVWLAEANRDDELKLQAQLLLVDVVGVRLSRHDDALVWGHHAQATVRRIDANEGELLHHLGAVYHAKGEYERAAETYESALALLEAEHTGDHSSIGRTLDGLASSLARLDRYDEAEALHRRAVSMFEELVGPDHPLVAVSLNNLGLVYYQQKKYDEALAGFERALAIDEAVLGPDHPKVATHLGNIGSVYYLQKLYQQARPYYERALAIQQAKFGDDQPQVAAGMINLGILISQNGDFEGARQNLERAIEIFEQKLGPEHPHVALASSNLGDIERRAGNLDAAIPAYERALAIREKALGDVLQTATSRLFLARALLDEGRKGRAIELLEAALVTRKRDLDPEDADITEVAEELERARGTG